MARSLTIKLECTDGSITKFFAFINRVLCIAEDGTAPCSWSGEVPDAQVLVKTRVLGVASAQYKFSIDLPGTANDQTLTLQLTGGYHEIEILL